MSLMEFAGAVDLPVSQLESLLAGREPISIDLAQRLTEQIGGSVAFWLARDAQYQDDLATVESDAWARRLPFQDMVGYGWCRRPANWTDRIDVALDFFGVANYEEWRLQFGPSVQSARYRFAGATRLDYEAVAVWLRQAELEAADARTAEWSPASFEDRLRSDIRPLTLERDPQVFMPRLVALAAASGVVVTVLRAPRGCQASGAARLLNDRPQIVLSARHLTDDHFWFTFLHEAGHSLLHSPAATYVDEFEKAVDDHLNREESEASAFAASLLIRAEDLDSLPPGSPTPLAIRRLARNAGVSPGIVVGQLQHRGRVGFESGLNRFKRHYRWTGTKLERA
jgi:Zn-dependent peptidase ImmA (M78 family)/plasmid maintenance system antidote protein VapI